MPVISTRYSTGSTYLPVGTYRSSLSTSATERSTSLERPSYTNTTESYLNRSRQPTTFRSSYSSTYSSSSAANYRLANGTSNDSYTSRYGVSNLSGSSFSASSVRVRPNIDKDLPPSGKTRSESRIRGGDSSISSSCTQCCTSGTGVNSLCSYHHHIHHTPHTRSSSLARNVALSGIDIYEKYSPANYQTKVELARSRSLSDNPHNHTTTSSTTVNNNNSKEISPLAVGIPKEDKF
jgi:ubiquitin carboxyl-terminal hydrolase 2/21